MRPTFSWFGVGLIVIGVVLLLDRLDVFYFDWTVAAWGLIGVFGGTRVVDGYRKKVRARLFWGTLLCLLGVYNVLRYLDVLPFHYHLLPPAILIILGLSILALFVMNPKEWNLLIPALSFIGLGTLWILVRLGYVYRYDVLDAIRFYWPLVLVLIGVSLLLRRKSV